MAKEPACLNESSSVLQRDDLDADVDHRQSVLNALIVQDKEEVSIHQITRCCCPRTLYRELLLRQDMPLAPVDDQGTQLHYADSGKTPSARTLMCLHGFSFNLTSFSSIMDIAPKHDIRIIAVNRRGYRYSSPYSEDELASVERPGATVEDYQAFMSKRAKEISRLLIHLIQHEDVKGDIALLGWSLGNQTTTSFLAEADHLPADERAMLEKQLKAIVFYDPPSHVFTAARPEQAYNPLLDERIPEADRVKAFSRWVSGHFDHPDPSSPDPHQWEFRNVVQSKPSYLLSLSEQDIAEGVDPAARREEALIWNTFNVAFWDKQGQRAFTSKAFPNIKLLHIWCDESGWECIASQFALAKHCAQPNARKLETAKVKGASHFYHREDPEAALSLFKSAFA